MATPDDLFNGPSQQDDFFGTSSQQDGDASSLFGGSAASGSSFFDQLAAPSLAPNGHHHDLLSGGNNFQSDVPPAKIATPSPAQYYRQPPQMQPPTAQQPNIFTPTAPQPTHTSGYQMHQATSPPTFAPSSAPAAHSSPAPVAAPPAASNNDHFNQFSTSSPQQNGTAGEELPADIFAASGDAFFDSLAGPVQSSSLPPANDFFAAAAAAGATSQHQHPSSFASSPAAHPVASPSQPTHPYLSSSPSPAAALYAAPSPSAPSSFPSHAGHPAGGGAHQPGPAHPAQAPYGGSPGGPQSSPYQPQAPHPHAQQSYPHHHSGPTPAQGGASEVQRAPSSFQGHSQLASSGGPPQPHHPYYAGSAPGSTGGGGSSGATFNTAGPVSVFTPVAQPPGSQGRSTAPHAAQQVGINPYPQPPATAPVPFMGRGLGASGPGFPTPPGSSGASAAASSSGAVAFDLSNGPQASGPGGGGAGQFTTFVPRPAQPAGPSALPGSYGGNAAPSPYADGFSSPAVADPGSTIPLNRLSSSGSALAQKPQVDAYGRTVLTQSAPSPNPGAPQSSYGGYLQPMPGGQQPYQVPGHNPHQQQHHRNRSVSLQPNNQQLADMPRVASNPEFARYGVMSPPGSGVPAHLAHNLSYLNSMPSMPSPLGTNPMQSQYGYPGGQQPDNGYGAPYGAQQNGGHPGWGDMSSGYAQQFMQPQPQDRLLFDRPHAVATFGFGGKLFTLFPRRKRKLNVYQPAAPEVDPQSEELLQGPLKILPVNEILSKTSFMNTFTSFPGPLKNASKDAVNKYVSNKASGASESEDAMADPEATQLLWSLLRVMCNHYGDLTQQDALKEVRQALLEGINPLDYNAASAAAASPLSGPALENAVKQVEQLLLNGEREKACHAAMEAGLWGHALFLASHLNPQLYQTVCKRFAQSTISEGSPLQTLYLLLAKCPQEVLKSLQGAGGSSSTAVDRWRENLAVILANRMQGDVKVIGQLGDILWSTQMRVAAAHFCYLVAETPFGPLENPNTRMILIGGDHKTQARLFVSPESVQRTEVFEYAKALGNSQYTLPAFQVYKFIYAATLADMGLLQQASNYYQNISAVVKDNAGSCSPAFLSQLHAFGDRISKIAPASRTAALAPPGWLSGLVQKGLSALIGDEKSASATAAATETINVQPSATAVPSAGVPMVSVVTPGTGAGLGLGPQGVAAPAVAPSPVMMQNPSGATPTMMMMNPASMPMMNPVAMMNPAAAPSPYQPHAGGSAAHFGGHSNVVTGPTPAYQQQQQQQQQADDDEEEDLMKSAFAKPKPGLGEERPGTPSSVAMDKSGGSASNSDAAKKDSSADKSADASGAGFWGRLGGLGLFRKKPTGKEMKLGQTENEYVYNEELGIWHEKGKPPPKEERGHSAPPPIMATSAPGSGSPFPSGYGSGPSPLGGSDGGNQFTKYSSPARGNRRYVDTFNPQQVYSPAPASMPTPGMAPASPATPAAYTVFTPPSTPMSPFPNASSPYQQ